MSVDRDLTKDFIKCLWRAWDDVAAVGPGADSRDSMSLDRDLTRLRKGLEEDSPADFPGEDELELVDKGLAVGSSEGQEELVGGLDFK